MGSTVKLKKCPDHEACQLESKDDGPWEHTPSSKPLGARLSNFAQWQRDTMEEIDVQGHKSRNRLRSATESEARFRQLEGGVDRTLSKVLAVEAKFAHIEDQVRAALSHAQQAEAHSRERLLKAEDKLATFDKVSHALARLESLQKELRDLSAGIRADMDRLLDRLNEVARQVTHEREERLEATAKEQRQIRALSQRIEDRR
jgi:hypothetical protein